MKKLHVRKQSLADRVIALIEGARQRVAYAANLAQEKLLALAAARQRAAHSKGRKAK